MKKASAAPDFSVASLQTALRASFLASLSSLVARRSARGRPRGFIPHPPVRLLAFTLLLALTGCGYHTAGHATRLPASVHTIAVPVFINQTQTYRIEQVLTRDVVREFLARTHYQIVNDPGRTADAVLKGTVFSAQAAPLTYDARSGRISSAIVTVSLKISLSDHQGRVFFENQNYTFRQEYQVSREVKSFFEEETPALQRMSQDFARTLVSDILEAF